MKNLKKKLDNIKKDNTFEKSLVSKRQQYVEGDEKELRMLFVMWLLKLLFKQLFYDYFDHEESTINYLDFYVGKEPIDTNFKCLLL